MKRLFEVNGEYFADKKAAKAARGEPTKPARTEEVNGRKVSVPPEYASTIRPGPDHWLCGGPVPGAVEAPAAKPVVKRKRKVAEAA